MRRLLFRWWLLFPPPPPLPPFLADPLVVGDPRRIGPLWRSPVVPADVPHLVMAWGRPSRDATRSEVYALQRLRRYRAREALVDHFYEWRGDR